MGVGLGVVGTSLDVKRFFDQLPVMVWYFAAHAACIAHLAHCAACNLRTGHSAHRTAQQTPTVHTKLNNTRYMMTTAYTADCTC